MTTLTEKFDALESAQATQNAAILASLSTMNTNLGGIGEAITLLTNTVLAGNRQLGGLIGNTGPCMPCPTPSIAVPPTSTTPHPIVGVRCQRAQALLAMIETVLQAYDNLMALNVVGAWTLISDVYGQTIATLGAGDTIPLPSFPEAVNIAGDYFSFAAGRLFSGETAVGDFTPLIATLRQAIYTVSTASAAQSAYNGVIDASGITNEGKLLLKATAYNELFSYFLDPSTMPALGGFDGSICSAGTCMTFSTEEMIHVDGEFGGGWIPDWSKYGFTNVSLPGQDNPVWVFRSWGNDSWDNTGYSNVYHQMQAFPTGTFDETGTFPTFPGDNWGTVVSPDGPFAIEICPDDTSP